MRVRELSHNVSNEDLLGVARVNVLASVTIEELGYFLALVRREGVPASWVEVGELGDVVDLALDGHEDLPGVAEGGDLVGGVLREVLVEVLAVHDAVALGLKAGLLDLELGLGDLVLLDPLEVVGEAEVVEEHDGPLGGVVVEPLDAVSVVLGELVVVVVIALAEGEEGGDDRVKGGVEVAVGLVAEVVGEGVDEEGGVVDEDDPGQGCIVVPAGKVTPAKAGNECRKGNGSKDDDEAVVVVLEDDHGVVVEVFNVGPANLLGVLLEHHPAKVGVEEALPHIVGVLAGIGELVVGPVVPAPPAGGALHGGGAKHEDDEADWGHCVPGAVGPEAVVPTGDAKAGAEVEDGSEDDGLALDWGGQDSAEGDEGNPNQNHNMEPMKDGSGC